MNTGMSGGSTASTKLVILEMTFGVRRACWQSRSLLSAGKRGIGGGMEA